MTNLNMILIAAGALMLVLYLMRRRSRMSRSDD